MGDWSVINAPQASPAAMTACIGSVYFFSYHCQTIGPNQGTSWLIRYPSAVTGVDDSGALNRMAVPQPALLPPLSLAQSVVIPTGCESSLYTRLVNSSWLFPEWSCTHSYIWTVSTVPPTSHTTHQTHSSSFPRNEGVFWTPLWLAFYFFFFFLKRWILVRVNAHFLWLNLN